MVEAAPGGRGDGAEPGGDPDRQLRDDPRLAADPPFPGHRPDDRRAGDGRRTASLVFLVFLLSFAMALYFGPDADQCWEWITPGSLVGSVVLLVVSVAFRVYVQNWGNYSATYGSLAGIVVLMSWVWLCALTLLTAGEVNKVIKDASPLGDSCGPAPVA